MDKVPSPTELAFGAQGDRAIKNVRLYWTAINYSLQQHVGHVMVERCCFLRASLKEWGWACWLLGKNIPEAGHACQVQGTSRRPLWLERIKPGWACSRVRGRPAGRPRGFDKWGDCTSWFPRTVLTYACCPGLINSAPFTLKTKFQFEYWITWSSYLQAIGRAFSLSEVGRRWRVWIEKCHEMS